jgi:hypothetical protein
MTEMTIEVDVELVAEICRLVRSRSKNPMEGLAVLVGSICLLKVTYLGSVSDEALAVLVADLLRSPKVVCVENPTHPGNGLVN